MGLRTVRPRPAVVVLAWKLLPAQMLPWASNAIRPGALRPEPTNTSAISQLFGADDSMGLYARGVARANSRRGCVVGLRLIARSAAIVSAGRGPPRGVAAVSTRL